MNEDPHAQDVQTTLADLVGVPAPDDTGATTAARYRFQAEVIVRDAIAVLVSGRGAVLCEWHEDAIVFSHAARPELVSVKHREPSQGPWTLRALVEDGGLRHLFERWRDTGGRARCRVSTNGGLGRTARQLRDACASEASTAIASISGSMARLLREPEDVVREFLASLRIEGELPARPHISAVNTTDLLVPALRRLGISALEPAAAYEALVRTVEEASRDRAAGSQEFLDLIADPRRLDDRVKREYQLRGRTLTADRLRDALAEIRPIRRPRLGPATGVELRSALEQKLVAGGFGPTAIRAAQRLRASWSFFEASGSDPLSDWPADLEDFATRLEREALEAEVEAMAHPDADGTWGRQMYLALKARLRAGPVLHSDSVPDDEALVEGFIFELTDRCAVWWSREFELSPP